jgi:hypothetical protein
MKRQLQKSIAPIDAAADELAHFYACLEQEERMLRDWAGYPKRGT